LVDKPHLTEAYSALPVPSASGEGNLPPKPTSPKGKAPEKSGKPSSPVSIPSSTPSTASQEGALRVRLFIYLLAYMNGEVPSSPIYGKQSALGTVKGGVASREIADKKWRHGEDTWYLKYDQTLKPHRWELVDKIIDQTMSYETIKENWRMIGAELVSPRIDLAQEDTWVNLLRELEQILVGEDQLAWFVDRAQLRVCFELDHDDDIALDVAKNLLSMYAMYEVSYRGSQSFRMSRNTPSN
jgi:hypothetical protein